MPDRGRTSEDGKAWFGRHPGTREAACGDRPLARRGTDGPGMSFWPASVHRRARTAAEFHRGMLTIRRLASDGPPVPDNRLVCEADILAVFRSAGAADVLQYLRPPAGAHVPDRRPGTPAAEELNHHSTSMTWSSCIPPIRAAPSDAHGPGRIPPWWCGGCGCRAPGRVTAQGGESPVELVPRATLRSLPPRAVRLRAGLGDGTRSTPKAPDPFTTRRGRARGGRGSENAGVNGQPVQGGNDPTGAPRLRGADWEAGAGKPTSRLGPVKMIRAGKSPALCPPAAEARRQVAAVPTPAPAHHFTARRWPDEHGR